MASGESVSGESVSKFKWIHSILLNLRWQRISFRHDIDDTGIELLQPDIVLTIFAMEGVPPGYTQEDILAALAAQSTRAPAAKTTFAELSPVAEGSSNDRKFYCPREGCSSTIISPGGATHVQADAGIVSTVETPHPSSRTRRPRRSRSQETRRTGACLGDRTPLTTLGSVAQLASSSPIPRPGLGAGT